MKITRNHKANRKYWRDKERSRYAGCRFCKWFKTAVIDYKVVCLKGLYSPATKQEAEGMGPSYICPKNKFSTKAKGREPITEETRIAIAKLFEKSIVDEK